MRPLDARGAVKPPPLTRAVPFNLAFVTAQEHQLGRLAPRRLCELWGLFDFGDLCALWGLWGTWGLWDQWGLRGSWDLCDLWGLWGIWVYRWACEICWAQ